MTRRREPSSPEAVKKPSPLSSFPRSGRGGRPFSHFDDQLQPHRVRPRRQWLAVNHSPARAQAPQERPHLDMFIRPPRPACHHPGSSLAHVFCDSTLCRIAYVHAREVHCHSHGNTHFCSARCVPHKAPRCFLGWDLGWRRGREKRRSHHTHANPRGVKSTRRLLSEPSTRNCPAA